MEWTPRGGQISDCGSDRRPGVPLSNVEITRLSQETLEDLAGEDLAGEDLGDLVQDGVMTSVLVAGALQARATLAGGPVDRRQLRSTLELAGIGAATAVTVHALLNLL